MHENDIAYRCTEALEAAAEAKSDALRLEKLAKRTYSQLIISGNGSVAYREHAARCQDEYIKAEEAYVAAQTKSNILEAKAEGLKLTFEYFRTRSADRRAEMQMR